MRQFGGQPPGQFAQQEGLAPAEVTEDQYEPGLVGGQPARHVRERVLRQRPVRHVQAGAALRHVQGRRVDLIGLQPPGLPVEVAAQVQHTLVLGHAQQPHTRPFGLRDQLGVGLVVPAVDQVAEQRRARGKIASTDRPDELLHRARVGVAVDQADHALFHHLPFGAPDPQVGGDLPGGLHPLDPGGRVAQAGHLGGVVQQVPGAVTDPCGWQGRPAEAGRSVWPLPVVTVVMAVTVIAAVVTGAVSGRRLGKHDVCRGEIVGRTDRLLPAGGAPATRGVLARSEPGEPRPVDPDHLVGQPTATLFQRERGQA